MYRSELLIGGKLVEGASAFAAISPYTGQEIGQVANADEHQVEAALSGATDAFRTWKDAPRRERQELLRKIAAGVAAAETELVDLAVQEIGKPLTWARGEVLRLGLTFQLAADLLSGDAGEWLPADYDPRGDGYSCRAARFPIGPIACIVPYNWPYNLAAHKIAPALAAGNTVVLKGGRTSSLCTLALARIIHEAGCPPGVLNAIYCEPALAERMCLDPRIAMLSFTGSPAVGWALKEKLPRKRVSLELGSNSFAIVCDDADLDWATPRLRDGGYGYAGQICISVQHILAARPIYDELKGRLIRATAECPTGDPSDERVVCGPLIDGRAADKVQQWVAEAVNQGASVLAGGDRTGNVLPPLLVEGRPPGARLSCQEVFGPVMTLEPFDTLDEAFAAVNTGSMGIHTGIFTSDIGIATRAFGQLETGGVVVNDYPTMRFDNMPYGGVKESGFGREGVRYTFDEMTELKSLVVRTAR